MRDNENLRRALERLADEAIERPDAERSVVSLATSRRRLTLGLASLSLLLIVGGISFAASSFVNEKATDLPITSGEEESTAARYFFRANGDGMEAHGVLEVHAEPPSICYEGTTRGVAASHLVGLPDENSDFPHPAPVLATFFEPGNENGATEPPGSEPICLRGEELGQMETQLQALIDEPHLFKIDFHGADETTATLEAELVPQGTEPVDPRTHVDEQDGVSVYVPEGWSVAEENLTPNLGDPREILSMGTSPLVPGGSCAQQPVNTFDAMGPKDAFISIQERRTESTHEPRPDSFRRKLENRFMNFETCTNMKGLHIYWYAFNDEGRDLYLLAVLGDEASRNRADDFWRAIESLDFSPEETGSEAVVDSDELVMAFGSDGDIFLALSDGSVVNVTRSPESESNPTISFDDQVLVYEREGKLVYLRLATGESAVFADGYSPAFGPRDYLAWDSGTGEIVVGSPFSDWTVRAPNGQRGQGATALNLAWDQSLELLYYSVAFGHGVSPHYIDVVRVDGWECAECGGGLELGRVEALRPDDGTEGEFLSTSFGTAVNVLRVCCREGEVDPWETAEIGNLDHFDTGNLYNRIRSLDDVPLDLRGGLLGLAHAGSLDATVAREEVNWRTTDRMAWFVISGTDFWLVAEDRKPVPLPFKVTGGVAVAPTYARSPLINST